MTGQQPAEAVRLANSGIDITLLDSLAHPTSCLPMLHQTQTLFGSESGRYQGYKLNGKTAAVIGEIERRLFAGIRLAAMKRMKPNPKPRPSRTANHPTVSVKIRDTILRRDNYRCIFCGRTSSSTALEVNHIIPRSLIRKLHLNPVLHTAPENLCVTCFSCNRGKSDNLATEDIEYYRSEFLEPGHPNHGLLSYFTKISELQKL